MSASPATSDDADVRVTAVGYAQLCAELEALRTVSRREMSEQLRDVREEGDPDNPLLFDRGPNPRPTSWHKRHRAPRQSVGEREERFERCLAMP